MQAALMIRSKKRIARRRRLRREGGELLKTWYCFYFPLQKKTFQWTELNQFNFVFVDVDVNVDEMTQLAVFHFSFCIFNSSFFYTYIKLIWCEGRLYDLPSNVSVKQLQPFPTYPPEFVGDLDTSVKVLFAFLLFTSLSLSLTLCKSKSTVFGSFCFLNFLCFG